MMMIIRAELEPQLQSCSKLSQPGCFCHRSIGWPNLRKALARHATPVCSSHCARCERRKVTKHTTV
jgi:hypothetical protein